MGVFKWLVSINTNFIRRGSDTYFDCRLPDFRFDKLLIITKYVQHFTVNKYT